MMYGVSEEKINLSESWVVKQQNKASKNLKLYYVKSVQRGGVFRNGNRKRLVRMPSSKL